MSKSIGRCPDCNGTTKVIRTRERADGDIIRTRKCKDCDAKYSTVERIMGARWLCNGIPATLLHELLDEIGIPVDESR